MSEVMQSLVTKSEPKPSCPTPSLYGSLCCISQRKCKAHEAKNNDRRPVPPTCRRRAGSSRVSDGGPHSLHFLLTHQTGLPGLGGVCGAVRGAESLQARLLERKRVAWVVASQTEDAPPDGDVPVNLDGVLVAAGSPVLLSCD